MSLTWAFILIGFAGLTGIAVGYVFRWLLVLGKKGSIELEIKQLMLEAREDAKKVVEAAEHQTKKMIEEGEGALKEKEEKLLRAEDRVFKREEVLDKKNQELEKEVETVKTKIEEVKQIKERAEKLVAERTEELARVAGLSREAAHDLLIKEIEKESEENLA